jgi:hypothetical protein
MLLLLYIVVGLIIVGVVLWGIDSVPFIDAGFKQLIKVVVVVAVMIILIGMAIGYVPVPPIKGLK